MTLSPGLVSYTKASLASCGGTAAASCHGEIRPYCDHAPCNATQVGHKRFNVSEDNRTFSVDLAIADAMSGWALSGWLCSLWRNVTGIAAFAAIP